MMNRIIFAAALALAASALPARADRLEWLANCS
jgi:hypothetical protein